MYLGYPSASRKDHPRPYCLLLTPFIHTGSLRLLHGPPGLLQASSPGNQEYRSDHLAPIR